MQIITKRGPAAMLTAIQGDSRTQSVTLQVPRYADGVDLSVLAWSVNAVNAAGDTDVYTLTATVSDEYIALDWLVRGVATAAVGTTMYEVEGVGEDANGNALIWQSGAGKISVKPAVEAEISEDTEAQLTALQQLIVYVDGELNNVIQAGKDAESAAEAANAAAAEVLRRADAGEFDGPKGDPGEGVPAGGAEGDVLTKSGAADYATEWAAPAVTAAQFAALQAQVDALYPTKSVGPAAVVAVDDALAGNAQGLTVAIEPVQAGSGDPSPENVRSITGWTGANIYCGGADQSDPVAIHISFAAAGTVYGGTLDVVTGVLTVDRAMVDFTGEDTWYAFSIGSQSASAICALSSPAYLPSALNAYNGAISSIGQENPRYWASARPNESPDKGNWSFALGGNLLRLYTTEISTITDLASFKAAIQSFQLCYTLASPTTYQLTPAQVALLRGNNTVWADTGDVTLTYKQDVALLLEKLQS